MFVSVFASAMTCVVFEVWLLLKEMMMWVHCLVRILRAYYLIVTLLQLKSVQRQVVWLHLMACCDVFVSCYVACVLRSEIPLNDRFLGPNEGGCRWDVQWVCRIRRGGGWAPVLRPWTSGLARALSSLKYNSSSKLVTTASLVPLRRMLRPRQMLSKTTVRVAALWEAKDFSNAAGPKRQPLQSRWVDLTEFTRRHCVNRLRADLTLSKAWNVLSRAAFRTMLRWPLLGHTCCSSIIVRSVRNGYTTSSRYEE